MMVPKFAKGDRVRVYATRFDKDEVEEGEQRFSETWAAEGCQNPDSTLTARTWPKENTIPNPSH
jgi:hypothetical protein